MVELLLRLETLLLELNAIKLLSYGIPLFLVGLFLWLSGDRFSAAIVGLLGAAVGAVAGLLIGQWTDFHLLYAMLIGAVVLAGISIWLRNALIVILASLVFAALGGAGYLTVKLDAMAQEDAGDQTRLNSIQSFRQMDLNDRLDYLDRVSPQVEDFSVRLRALLEDTWQAVEPHLLMVILATVVGGLGSLLLLRFIKSVVVLVAYSVVGTTAAGMGLHAMLLAFGVQAVSLLSANRWILPIGFAVLIVCGCICQVVLNRRAKSRREAREPEDDEIEE